MNTTVTEWIRRHAYPLTTLEPQAPLTDLAALHDLARGATVVAIGASTRQAHELSTLSHRILRLLVEQLGFRSLALEGDEISSARLDEYVRTGAGDPEALLAGARTFWRTEEILEVVRWLRAYNQRHPAGPVRLVHGDSAGDFEQLAAANTIRWHDRTGHKIAYWGGIAHTAISPSSTHRSAGSHLRERFGPGYVSIGLTFHHGALPVSVPNPPAGFVENALSSTGIDTYLLDLHAERPNSVQAWLDAPAMTRLVGPHYDPANDAAHHLSGGSLATWFDLVGHVREVTPIRPLVG